MLGNSVERVYKYCLYGKAKSQCPHPGDSTVFCAVSCEAGNSTKVANTFNSGLEIDTMDLLRGGGGMVDPFFLSSSLYPCVCVRLANASKISSAM